MAIRSTLRLGRTEGLMEQLSSFANMVRTVVILPKELRFTVNISVKQSMRT